MQRLLTIKGVRHDKSRRRWELVNTRNSLLGAIKRYYWSRRQYHDSRGSWNVHSTQVDTSCLNEFRCEVYLKEDYATLSPCRKLKESPVKYEHALWFHFWTPQSEHSCPRHRSVESVDFERIEQQRHNQAPRAEDHKISRNKTMRRAAVPTCIKA